LIVAPLIATAAEVATLALVVATSVVALAVISTGAIALGPAVIASLTSAAFEIGVLRPIALTARAALLVSIAS
jgi:hypothetical protein